MAGGRATKQLLGIPWNRFHKMYARYPRWLAFTLWTQAILAAEDRTPSWLVAAVKKRCPGFVDSGAPSIELGLLSLRLQEWIHGEIFREAKEDCWLDALIFFGVRDLRSQATWAYWEHCQRAWGRRRPRSFPAFEKWWKTGRQYQFCEKATTAQIATALERYVELQAIAYWLHPLLEANREVPAAVAAELEGICPGFFAFGSSIGLGKQEAQGGLAQRLTRWMEDQYFAQPKKEGWLNIVVEQANNDPRHVRMVEFWKRSSQDWPRNPAIAYPSLSQWRLAADRYIAE